MGKIIKLSQYASVVNFSDGKSVGTSLGTDNSVPKLIAYRMKFLSLSSKDRLLDIVFTPDVLKRLCTFFNDLSPNKGLTRYLAQANSIEEARILCRELEKKLIEQ